MTSTNTAVSAYPITDVANRIVENLHQLKARLTHRVKALMTRPEHIARLTAFQWWRDAVPPIV